jgi:hypothetical protein
MLWKSIHVSFKESSEYESLSSQNLVKSASYCNILYECPMFYVWIKGKYYGKASMYLELCDLKNLKSMYEAKLVNQKVLIFRFIYLKWLLY